MDGPLGTDPARPLTQTFPAAVGRISENTLLVSHRLARLGERRRRNAGDSPRSGRGREPTKLILLPSGRLEQPRPDLSLFRPFCRFRENRWGVMPSLGISVRSPIRQSWLADSTGRESRWIFDSFARSVFVFRFPVVQQVHSALVSLGARRECRPGDCGQRTAIDRLFKTLSARNEPHHWLPSGVTAMSHIPRHTHRAVDQASTTPAWRAAIVDEQEGPASRRARGSDPAQPGPARSLLRLSGHRAPPVCRQPRHQLSRRPLSRIGVAGFGNGDEAPYVQRYTADGQLDPTFGTLGTADDSSNVFAGNLGGFSLGLEPDGKIVQSVQYNVGAQLVRYNPDGSADLTFGTSGATAPLDIEVNGQMSQLSAGYGGIAVLPDGRIVMAGEVGGSIGLAMYRADGTLDPSFNGTGTLVVTPDPGPTLTALTIIPDWRSKTARSFSRSRCHRRWGRNLPLSIQPRWLCGYDIRIGRRDERGCS